jgi:hypothetical protein
VGERKPKRNEHSGSENGTKKESERESNLENGEHRREIDAKYK